MKTTSPAYPERLLRAALVLTLLAPSPAAAAGAAVRAPVTGRTAAMPGPMFTALRGALSSSIAPAILTSAPGLSATLRFESTSVDQMQALGPLASLLPANLSDRMLAVRTPEDTTAIVTLITGAYAQSQSVAAAEFAARSREALASVGDDLGGIRALENAARELSPYSLYGPGVAGAVGDLESAARMARASGNANALAARLLEGLSALETAPADGDAVLVGARSPRSTWTQRLASLGRFIPRGSRSRGDAVPAPQTAAAPIDLAVGSVERVEGAARAAANDEAIVAAAPNLMAASDAPNASARQEAANDPLVIDERLEGLVEEMKTWREKRGQGDALTLEAINHFLDRYQAIAGHRPAFADNLTEALRDQGAALLSMRERRILIGAIGFSGRKSDEQATQDIYVGAIQKLLDRGVSPNDIAIVGGFTNLGSIKAAYAAARMFPGVEAQGVASGRSMDYVVALVQKALLIGREFGTESPLFTDLIDFAIGTGGGGQGEKELRWMASHKGGNTYIVKGILEIKADGTLAPGAADKIEAAAGGHHLTVENGDWNGLGRRIGDMIYESQSRIESQRADSTISRLVMPSAPEDLSELGAWAQSKISRYRALRIVDALRKRLETLGVSAQDNSRLQSDALAALDKGVAGIDNFAANGLANGLWQNAARAALLSVGGQVEELTRSGALSSGILFASWFGIRDVEVGGSTADLDLSPFDSIHDLPDVPAPSAQNATFNVAEYAELRLDNFGQALLLGKGSAPEVFLGSKAEMNAFYARKGYRPTKQFPDSNGTTYFLFEGPQGGQAVIQGVDSEARLAHLTAMMKSRGIDTSAIRVRGNMTGQRREKRNTLEFALSEYGLTGRFAGVVIGDKANIGATLARRAGADAAADVRRGPEIQVGPFRFDVYKVKPAGATEESFILGYSPAYGELTYDEVKALLNAGARNLMLGGAGGTLRTGEKAGATHNVVSSEYQGDRIDLRAIPGVEILRVREAKDAHNVTTDSPLRQTQSWAEEQRLRGADNADQETYHVFRAVRDWIAEETERSGEAETVRLQVGLHMSDAVGSNGLAAGTADETYAPNIGAMFNQFLDRLGVAAVVPGESPKSSDAAARPLSEPVPGLLQAAPRRAQTILADSLPITDASTVWANGLGGSTRQMKGQKRVLLLESGTVGPEERRALGKFLEGLSPERFWVAIRQDDPNFIQLYNKATVAGMEIITLETTPEGPHGRFILRAPDAAGLDALAEELTRAEKPLSYEPNIAAHYRIGVGREGQLLTIGWEEYQKKAGEASSQEKKEDEYELVAGRRVVAANSDLKAADLAVGAQARELMSLAAVNETKVRSAIESLFASKNRRAPRFVSREGIAAFLAGRQPVLFSGGSRKQWPDVTPENQALVRETIEKLLSRLDPKRHVIVTGGTEYGVEQIVHEVAALKGFEIVGTITENTDAAELSPKLTAVVQYAIGWFGKSRPVLMELVKAHGGFVVFQAGGKILADEIELAVRLKVPLFLQRGPQGAADAAAATYGHLAFRTFEDLAEKVFGPQGVSVTAAGRSLRADEIHDIASRADMSPAALIRAFKRDPFLRRQFEARIGAWEKFRLDEHTAMNMGQFERYWGGQTGVAGFTSADMRIFLALHDIGRIKADEIAAALRAELIELEKTDKAEATRRWPEIEREKARQHEYTDQLMRAYLPLLGYTEAKIAIFTALAYHDPIGGLSRDPKEVPADRRMTPEMAIANIRAGAKAAGLPERDFFRLVKRFYFSDAGSYTEDAGGLYQPRGDASDPKIWGGRPIRTREGSKLYGPSLGPVFTFDREKGRVDFSPAVEARLRPLLVEFEGPLVRLENGAVLDRAVVGDLRTRLSQLDGRALRRLVEAARTLDGYVPAPVRETARRLGLIERGLTLSYAARSVLLSAGRDDESGGMKLGAPVVGTLRDEAPVRMAALRDGAHFPLSAVNREIVLLKALERDDPAAFAGLLRAARNGAPARADVRARLGPHLDGNGHVAPLAFSLLRVGYLPAEVFDAPARWPHPIDRVYDPLRG